MCKFRQKIKEHLIEDGVVALEILKRTKSDFGKPSHPEDLKTPIGDGNALSVFPDSGSFFFGRFHKHSEYRKYKRKVLSKFFVRMNSKETLLSIIGSLDYLNDQFEGSELVIADFYSFISKMLFASTASGLFDIPIKYANEIDIECIIHRAHKDKQHDISHEEVDRSVGKESKDSRSQKILEISKSLILFPSSIKNQYNTLVGLRNLLRQCYEGSSSIFSREQSIMIVAGLVTAMFENISSVTTWLGCVS